MHDSLQLKPVNVSPPSGSSESVLNWYTITTALRCWWKAAAPAAIISATVFGVVAFYLIKPKYTASVCLVIHDRSSIVSQDAANEPVNFVENQKELMRSQSVLEPVASNPTIASTPELVNELDPVVALRKKLIVKALGRSNFFTIEFTSTDREKAAMIVNEVADGYIAFQEQTQATRGMRTIEILRSQQGAQQTVVETLRNTVQTLTKRITGNDAFVSRPQQNVVELRTTLTELQTGLVTAEVEQAVLAAQVQAESEFLAKQSFEPLASEVDREVEITPQVLYLKQRIAQAKMLLKEHERTSANLARNPAYQQIVKRLRDDEVELEKARGDQRALVKAQLEKVARSKRQEDFTVLKNRLASSEFTIKVLRDRLAEELKGRKEYQGETLQLEFARADFERASKVYEAITDKILAMQMVRQAPPRVEIFQKAVPPLAPSGSSVYQKILAVAFCGFLAPFAVALAFEHFCRRVSTRIQLETNGRIAVVGEVTALPPRFRSRRNGLGRPNRELQLFEESINGLRTRLSLLQSLEGVQVLTVTSAVSGEGKTTLASQLAVSIARASGQPTLLIDGDLRAPNIHQVFGIERGEGLSDVLQGTVPLEQAIEIEFNNTLHLLTAGSVRVSPHRLLGNDGFEAVIGELKGMYRQIIIDTPPILSASESLVLSRAADVTLVCARRDYSRFDQVLEAFACLNAAGAKAVGAVLTGVPSRIYAYKYGRYYHAQSGDAGQQVVSHA